MPDPSGPDADMVAKGKELCEDLVANVKEQYREFRARPRFHNSGGYGDHGRGSSHGGGNNNNSYSSYNRYGSEAGASNSPAPPGVQSPSTSAADYAAQYAQYYNGADPYAAWGGYAKYTVPRP